MNKIHFASLFGVDYELDLLYFWAPYYLNMNFDSYKIFLHRERGNIGENIKNEFKNMGFSIETIDGPQGNGVLRKLVLGHYAGTLPPADFLVTADADEFQSLPSFAQGATEGGYGHALINGIDVQVGLNRPRAPDYRQLLSQYDIVTGYMVDRFSERLEACFKYPFVQYPYEEVMTRDFLKDFTPPFLRKTNWPVTRRTKILAARCGYEVAFEGSHCMLSVPAAANIATDYKVIHFAWRESAKRKLAIKSYYSQENLDEIFGGNVPSGYAETLKRISPEAILTCGN